MKTSFLDIVMLNGCGQSFFHRPPTVQSRTNTRWMDVHLVSPVWQALRFPVVRQPTSRASIAVLHMLRCPDAIVRGIPFIIQLSLYGICRSWSGTHIFIKQLKRIFPALTHRDAATAVTLKRRVIRIQTAALHRFPYFIFRRLGQSMSPTAKPCLLRPLTPATRTTSYTQTSLIDGSDCATDTLTYPVAHTRRMRRCKFQHRPGSKRWKFREIYEGVLRHDASLQAMVSMLGSPCARPQRLARPADLPSTNYKYKIFDELSLCQRGALA